MFFLVKLLLFPIVAFASPIAYYNFDTGCGELTGSLCVSQILVIDGTLYVVSAPHLLELVHSAEGEISCKVAFSESDSVPTLPKIRWSATSYNSDLLELRAGEYSRHKK
jgi:hypothetical protein